MSKIYDKYLELKNKDKNKLYLFHSGKFYIFIDKDADYINEYLVLKKVKFTNNVYKCGFPDTSLENYLHVFKNHHLNIEVIENIDKNEIDHNIDDITKYNLIKNRINNVNLNNITPLDAFNILMEIKEWLKK